MIDYLSAGSSDPYPLNLEVSTAVGDSGGPLIARQKNSWRIFGTVSYGTSNSTYGDVTILTRLSNHVEWIRNQLPVWPSEMIINNQGWRESEWLGYFLPTPSGWNFHSKLGWFWSLPVDDENIWLFVNGLEWLWLTRTNFPFVYFYKEKNWFYIDVEMSNLSSWLIYDFNSGSWTAIEFIPPSP